MTTEHQVMTFLERADPARSGDVVDLPISARRYLETRVQQRSTAMSIVQQDRPDTEQPNRRWPFVAAAAAVVALVIGSIAFIVASQGGDDDTVPATVPITTPETIPPTDSIEGAQSAVADLVAIYNTGDTDAVLALMADGVLMTRSYGAGRPNPDGVDPEGRDGVERHVAWNNAQGEQWTEPFCELADEQRPAGTTLDCTWDTLDAVVQAADLPPIPTRALVVVGGSAIAELHLGYSTPDFATTARNYNSWMEYRHPVEAEFAGCCEGATREESVARGEARAEWAEQWATFRDTYGCAGAAPCTISSPEWAAEYEALCAMSTDAVLSAEAVEQMRAFPLPFQRGFASEDLLEADEELLASGLDDAQVAALQQTRLDAMLGLGIDAACHPDVG